jgi:hypothetical protein
MARRRAWARLCEVTAVWWLAWSRAMRTVTVKESGSAPHLCPRMGREALALSPVLRTPPLPAAHDRAGPGVSTRPELRDRHNRPPRIRAQYGRDRAVPQVRLRRGRAPRPAVPALQRRAVGHDRDGPDARADSRRSHVSRAVSATAADADTCFSTHARHGPPTPRLQLFPWMLERLPQPGLDTIVGCQPADMSGPASFTETPDLFVPLHLHP